MLELVGLPGYGPRPITTLSGGQAQRVALARALAPRPRLLLLDEPLSALDRALREQLAVDLRAILAEQGTTALYVTHDQDEAMTVADEVGVMEAGRSWRARQGLRRQYFRLPSGLAASAELWADPGSASVAAFLGFGPILTREQTEALGWAVLLDGGRPGAREAGSGGGGAALALAPGALSVVGLAGEAPRGDDAGAPGTAMLPEVSGTVLARRVRRGRVEADVSLDFPDGDAVVATGVNGVEGPAGEIGTTALLRLDPTRTANIEF